MTTIDQLREDLAEARATSALNAEALAVCQRGVQTLRLELEAQREKTATVVAACEELDLVFDAITTPGKRGHWLDKVEDVRIRARAALAKAGVR